MPCSDNKNFPFGWIIVILKISCECPLEKLEYWVHLVELVRKIPSWPRAPDIGFTLQKRTAHVWESSAREGDLKVLGFGEILLRWRRKIFLKPSLTANELSAKYDRVAFGREC